MKDWQDCFWSEHSAATALAALAAECGWTVIKDTSRGSELEAEEMTGLPEHLLTEQLEGAALALQLDVLPAEVTLGDLPRELSRLSPAIVRVSQVEDQREGSLQKPGRTALVAILAANRTRVTCLTPDREKVHFAVQDVCKWLTGATAARPKTVVDFWLEGVRLPPGRVRRAHDRLLKVLLADHVLRGIWLVRRDAGAPAPGVFHRSRWRTLAGTYAVASIVYTALTMVAWWVLAQAYSRPDGSYVWIQAWALVVISAIPFQMLIDFAGGSAGVELGVALRQRLLCGALRIEPEIVDAQGSGGLLALVSESQALERAGLEGTFAAATALVHLVGGAVVLSLGPVAALQISILVACLVLFAWCTRRVLEGAGRTTRQRFDLSALFVEHVLGRRTRLCQGDARDLHASEEVMLERYSSSLRDAENASALAFVWPARGWFLLSMLALIPALLSASSMMQIAVSIGGILQTRHALTRLSQCVPNLIITAVAWQSIKQIYRAAQKLDGGGGAIGLNILASVPAALEVSQLPRRQPRTVLELRSVSFSYPDAKKPCLRDCSVQLREGERWLLTGDSGSGKSTLVGLMSGLYKPSSGLVMLQGLDRATLGANQWRRRVASAPQFHQNYLFSGSLAFNLLMGRSWPAGDDDLREARELCDELGLGPLLQRMPSGLHQIVGETGWQLSHGERSRVYLARALLQRGLVTILDESFGALDPVTMRMCMEVARRRASTLIVIAHH
jgi:ATP-binding cassette subfamily B protein